VHYCALLYCSGAPNYNALLIVVVIETIVRYYIMVGVHC
jgi:hypothetical protein